MTDYKKQGKRNRINGAIFEKRVREDLESKGWIVSRWGNNIEFQKYNSEEVSGIHVNGKFIYGKLIQAKSNRFLMRSTGFPDFIAFTYANSNATWPIENYDKTFYISGINAIIGVEVKINGYLDPTEREKCRWLLKNNIFSRILIASKLKISNRIKIKYEEFK